MCRFRSDRLDLNLRQFGSGQRMESFLVSFTCFLRSSGDFSLVVGLQGEFREGEGRFQVGVDQLNLINVLPLPRFRS